MSNCKISFNGTKTYINNDGFYHREDGPAVEYTDGYKSWFLNGKRHRIDGPAIEYANGDKEWFVNGLFHREDGPAYEYVDGTKRWYYQNKRIKCSSNEEFLKLIKLKVFW